MGQTDTTTERTYYLRRASFNADGTPRGSAFSVTVTGTLRPVDGGHFLRGPGYFVGEHTAPNGVRMVTTAEPIAERAS